MLDDKFHRGKFDEITDRAGRPDRGSGRHDGARAPDRASAARGRQEAGRPVAAMDRGAVPAARSTSWRSWSRTSAATATPSTTCSTRSTWRRPHREDDEEDSEDSQNEEGRKDDEGKDGEASDSDDLQRQILEEAEALDRRAARGRLRGDGRAPPPRCPTTRRWATPTMPPSPGVRAIAARTSRAVPTIAPSRPSSTRPWGRRELCEAEELDRLRSYLDKQLAHLQGRGARLANPPAAPLMAQQKPLLGVRSRRGHPRSGRGSPASSSTPMHPLSFKREKETNFRDTVVTLLLDNFGLDARTADHGGGDLRRHPGAHAGALPCVKVEILGFTTRAWKGGQSREAWLAACKPPNPAGSRPAPHHLQVGRRTVAARAQESRPDDARGPAQGEYRRRGARTGRTNACWRAPSSARS